MKYNTDKNKLIMFPIETKERLDLVIKLMIEEKIKNGETKLRVSYADAVKFLLEKSNFGI
jgi:hypothetical protein